MPNSPSALCIQDLVLKMLEDINPCNFLEVGVGCGDFLVTLGKRDLKGQGIDISDVAVRKTNETLKRHNLTCIDVEQCNLMDMEGKFDTVFAIEVIEHFKDDVSALKKVCDLLAENGYFIFSVPANMKAWGPSDVSAGHYRRYGKEEITGKLHSSGFKVVNIWSAAYPVGNVLKIFRDKVQQKKLLAEELNSDEEYYEKTRFSGVEKIINAPDWLYNVMFNRLTTFPILLVQRPFLNTDLGFTYVIKAKKI